MGVFNKTFIRCDHCNTEHCIDDTGECGLPVSELLPSRWRSEDNGIICPACRNEVSEMDAVLNALRELHDFAVADLMRPSRPMNAFDKARGILKRYGK